MVTMRNVYSIIDRASTLLLRLVSSQKFASYSFANEKKSTRIRFYTQKRNKQQQKTVIVIQRNMNIYLYLLKLAFLTKEWTPFFFLPFMKTYFMMELLVRLQFYSKKLSRSVVFGSFIFDWSFYRVQNWKFKVRINTIRVWTTNY